MSMEIRRTDPSLLPPDMSRAEQRKQQHVEPSAPSRRENPEPKEQTNVQEVLDEMLRMTYAFNKKLKFSINRELGSVVVKVVDVTTDKVIKEIPPEELQRLHLRIKEAIGLLVDKTI